MFPFVYSVVARRVDGAAATHWLAIALTLLIASCGGGSGAAGDDSSDPSAGSVARRYEVYTPSAGGKRFTPAAAEQAPTTTLVLQQNAWQLEVEGEPGAAVGGLLETLPNGQPKLHFELPDGEGGTVTAELYAFELRRGFVWLFLGATDQSGATVLSPAALTGTNRQGACAVNAAEYNHIRLPEDGFDAVWGPGFGLGLFSGSPLSYNATITLIDWGLEGAEPGGEQPVDSCEAGRMNLAWGDRASFSASGLAALETPDRWMLLPRPAEDLTRASLQDESRRYVGILLAPLSVCQEACVSTVLPRFVSAVGTGTAISVSAFTNLDSGAVESEPFATATLWRSGFAPNGLFDEARWEEFGLDGPLRVAATTVGGRVALAGILHRDGDGTGAPGDFSNDWGSLVLIEQ